MRTSVLSCAGVGDAEPLARGALVVPQPSFARVGDRGVGEQQLPGREVAGVVFLQQRAIAKEGDLDAEVPAALVLHPAGDVPPLGPVAGMRTMVARKDQRRPGLHRRIACIAPACRGRQEHRKREQDSNGSRDRGNLRLGGMKRVQHGWGIQSGRTARRPAITVRAVDLPGSARIKYIAAGRPADDVSRRAPDRERPKRRPSRARQSRDSRVTAAPRSGAPAFARRATSAE